MAAYITSHRQKVLRPGLRVPQSFYFATALAIALLTSSTGCFGLRLPRIDPTGQSIFLPYPEYSTEVNCLAGSNGSPSPFNGPAFETPPPPPPCPLSAPIGGPSAIGAPLLVDDCMSGPPAVLTGGHLQARDLLHLPEKGKRGRIMLTPQRVVAPVGGEVILLAGVCGNDGYLMTGEPLEWMISPDSVGNIIQIGDDDRCKLHRMISNKRPTQKVDADYAIGRTTSKPTLITRGTRTTRDDVELKKGEAWISLSSPSEGVSRITVLAPENDCWDHRKATTTIYWIDANWMFPEPQVVAAKNPARLITRVTRSDRNIPAEGWIVRYQSLTPTIGGFGPNLLSVVEVPVNRQGEAPVEVFPVPNTSGQVDIEVQIIRPAESDFPQIPLATGHTAVTWAAPDLRLEARGPEIAGFDQPITIVAQLQNPGQMPAQNVELMVQLPPGVTYVGSNLENQNLPNRVIWPIRDTSGQFPAKTQLDVMLTVRARQPFVLNFAARGSNVAEVQSTVQVDVYQPSLSINVRPVNDRVDVGSEATFEIELTNTGSRPLSALRLQADGGTGLNHLQTAKNSVALDYDQPSLAPGQTWRKSVTFRVLQPGQQCIRVTGYADAAQQTSANACVIGLNAPIPTPSVIGRITGEPTLAQRSRKIINMFVGNNGRIPLTNVRVVATYDNRVTPIQAETGVDTSLQERFQLAWTLPRLDPNQEQRFSVEVEGISLGESSWIMTVQSAEGAQDTKSFNFQIVPGLAPSPAAPIAPPIVPTQPTPRIPPANEVLPDRSPSDVMPPTTPPVTGATGAGLTISITDSSDPVRVQEDIRYMLSVKNDRNTLDDTVQVRIYHPESFAIQNLQLRTGGRQTPIPRSSSSFDLPTINTLRPGETVEYELIFRTNLPQSAQIRVEAQSRLTSPPVIDTETTEIQAR